MKNDSRPWLNPGLPPLPPPTESEERQIKIYRAMNPIQRWAQAVKLREMAWSIRRSSLRRKHPEWTEAEIDKAVREFFIRAST